MTINFTKINKATINQTSVRDTLNLTVGGDWTPLDLSPDLWLDATVGVLDTGGAVYQWNDQSGNGNDFDQVTGANQPITDSRTINSLNAIDFNGTTHFMEPVSILNVTQSFTIAVVVQYDVVTGNVALWGNTTSNHFCYTSASKQTMRLNGGPLNPNPTTLVNGTTYLMVFRYDGVNAHITVNGSDYSVADDGVAWVFFAISKLQAGSGFVNGLIGEFILVNSYVSDLSDLNTYVNGKWGTSI